MDVEDQVGAENPARDSDIADYLDAIGATMRCERVSGGACRCTIPVLERWEATDSQKDRCRFLLQARVIAWIVRRVAHKEAFPAFGGLQPRIRDVVAPDILTERLRLVPYTATLKAVAHCNSAALGALLGARVDEEWPEGMGAIDAEEAASNENMLDWLHVFWTLQKPASAPWNWMIIDRTENILIGAIGTTNPPADEPGEDSIQIGYYLVPGYRGRGYMTEAGRAYIAWAFAQPSVSWIYAMTETNNSASRRVLEKIGARPFTGKNGSDGSDGWLDWEIMPDTFR